MFRNSDHIKIIIGILIVGSIFVFIGICTLAEKKYNEYSILDYDSQVSNDVPEECIKEIIDVQAFGGYSIKVDKEKKVIGFSLLGDSYKCFHDIKNHLQTNNWCYVESGSLSSASFYKNEGTCRWLFVNCINFEGETSVVLTIN